jgi:hypothetical protein
MANNKKALSLSRTAHLPAISSLTKSRRSLNQRQKTENKLHRGASLDAKEEGGKEEQQQFSKQEPILIKQA